MNIIKMRFFAFPFEKTHRISLSCRLVPVPYRYDEYGLFRAKTLPRISDDFNFRSSYSIELLTTYILRRLEALTVLEQEDSFEVLLADHLATFSSKLLFPLCSEL